MAEEPLFEVEYDDDGRPTHMRVGKHGIRLTQEDAQRIFDEYFDMRDTVDIMRDENAKLKAQNKRLRKECTSLRKSREREFAKSCEAATNHLLEVSVLRDKNAELRGLVYRMVSYVSNPPCYGCSFEMTCDGHDITRCDEWSLIVSDARRAGIEVD
jgi:predicted RNase H-like nuclease (RuvC/YqgF family)